MSGPVVLVTGGAGYIGSHTAHALCDAGFRVVVLDDLSSGVRAGVPAEAVLIRADVADRAVLGRLFAQHRIAAVMHFAGSISVPESVARPLLYYRNNTAGSLALLEACEAAGIGAFIFSSTAAVYGTPATVPTDEDAPLQPINPYGRSKLMTELMLADAAAAHGLRYAALRYFNAAGADPAGRCGQSTRGAGHLVKAACQVAIGKRERLDVFGLDYPTPDGTCVRDYIHVGDLADAHVLALVYLLEGGESLILNCGYGRGHSVREVIAAVERAAGHELPVRSAPRRPGDPATLVAASGRLRSRLGWTPRHDDLDEIVASALAWERRLAETPLA